ncbi:cytidylyltransferase domain-containing protein [Sulfurimonas sp.]|uniref:cytidylyltransferase domain-containing protein n=1 Tax=Sulfurimonas sp. TaxID=2022749 RepID=UPI002B47DDD6|nr:HAD hydrolase family protein [Sulfurimonas sp.]
MNIAFIPARCGSKAIRFKNIKEFCGKPLIYWNLLALENATLVDEVFVATDCIEISEVVESFGFDKVKIYMRDRVNAQDESSTEDVMLEFLNKNSFSKDALFMLVQATSPTTQSHDFDGGIKELLKSKKDSLLSVVREKRFFWNNDGNALNYDYKNRPRRQDFDGYLLENGAFYINRVSNILRDNNRLSAEIAFYEMHDYTSIEIDEKHDWKIAEEYMKENVLYRYVKERNIKLFLSDVDGTLTDAGMYYGENSEELKKFNTHDGKGFELLRKVGIKTGIITSEDTKIVRNRAKKLKVDYLYQGLEHKGKLDIVKEICSKEGISLDEVAYIGDDVNCKELLEAVGVCACPKNALPSIKSIPNIIELSLRGGDGAVREFVDIILR